MKPKTPARVWCDGYGITPRQARRLGGVAKLCQLRENHRETFDFMIQMARQKRKKAA